MLAVRNAKDVGALLLAYPTVGLSHCLVQDKQLELAHAVIYYTRVCTIKMRAGIIHPTQTLRCVISGLEFARFSSRR